MALTLDGTNGIVSSGSITTQSATGVIFSDSSSLPAASSPYVLKNRLINSDMRIDQRNAGASITPASGSFITDRFVYFAAQASKVTAQQSTTAPTGFVNSLLVTSSSAYTVGASENFTIGQLIEGLNVSDLGWGTANAQTVTLSFWVRSSLTGTFGGSVLNSASNRSYPFTYTILAANTWEYKTVTIAGDTTGTWLTTNGVGIRLYFNLGAGSTVSGTAGSWSGSTFYSATGATSVVGTNGATWYITGVQLEQNTSATPFERRLYDKELISCQRYFEKSYNVGTAVGANTSDGIIIFAGSTNQSGNIQLPIFFKVPKRSAPTMTGYLDSGTSGQWSYSINGTSSSATFNSGATGENSTRVFVGTGSNWASANCAGHYTASAEL